MSSNVITHKSTFEKVINITIQNTLKSHFICGLFIILEYVPLFFFATDTKILGPFDTYEVPNSKYQNVFSFFLKWVIPDFYFQSDESIYIDWGGAVFGLIVLAAIAFLILYLMVKNDSHNQIEISSFISVMIRTCSDYLYFFFRILNFHVMNVFFSIFMKLSVYDSTNQIIGFNLGIKVLFAFLALGYQILSIVYSRLATNYLYFSHCNLFPNVHAEATFHSIEKILLALIYTFDDQVKYTINYSFYILFFVFSMIYIKNTFSRFVYINNSYTHPIKFFLRVNVLLQFINIIFTTYTNYQDIYNSSFIGGIILIISAMFTLYVKKKTDYYLTNFSYIKFHLSIDKFYNHFSSEKSEINTIYNSTMFKLNSANNHLDLNDEVTQDHKNSKLEICDLFNIFFHLSRLGTQQKIDYFTKLINKNINYSQDNPLYSYFSPKCDRAVRQSKKKLSKYFSNKEPREDDPIIDEEDELDSSRFNPEKESVRQLAELQKTFFYHLIMFINTSKGLEFKIGFDIIQINFLENFIGTIVKFEKPGTYEWTYYYTMNRLYDHCISIYKLKSKKEAIMQLTENMLEFTKHHRSLEQSLAEIVEFKLEFLNLINNSQSIYLKFDIISKFSEKFGKLKSQIENVIKVTRDHDTYGYIYLPYETKFFYAIILKDSSINREISIPIDKIAEDFSEESANKPFYVTLKIDQIRSCWRFHSFSNTLCSVLKINSADIIDANINIVHPPFLKAKYHQIISKFTELNPYCCKSVYPLDSKKNIVSLMLESKVLPGLDMNLYMLCSLKKELDSNNTITFMVMEDNNRVVAFSSNCSYYFGLNSELVSSIDFDFYELFQLGLEFKNNKSTDAEILISKFYKYVCNKFDKMKKDMITKDLFYEHFSSPLGKNLLSKSYSARIFEIKKTTFVEAKREPDDALDKQYQSYNYRIYKMSILNSEELMVTDSNMNMEDSSRFSKNSRHFSNEGSSIISSAAVKTKITGKKNIKEMNINSLLKVIFIFNLVILVLSLFQIVVSLISKNNDIKLLDTFDTFNRILTAVCYSQLSIQKLTFNQVYVDSGSKSLNQPTVIGRVDDSLINQLTGGYYYYKYPNSNDFFIDEKNIYLDLLNYDTSLISNLTQKINQIQVSESSYFTANPKIVTLKTVSLSLDVTEQPYPLLAYMTQLHSQLLILKGNALSGKIKEFRPSIIIDKQYAYLIGSAEISESLSTLNNILINSNSEFYNHLKFTYQFLTDLKDSLNYTTYLTIIIFFFSILLLKILFLGFLLFKTYYIFIKFKKNISDIENLSQQRVISDIQALTKLKLNMRGIFTKEDFEYLVKKCDKINTIKAKINREKEKSIHFKTPTPQEKDEDDDDGEQSGLKQQIQGSSIKKGAQSSNRELVLDNDNIGLSQDQLQKKIQQVEKYQDQQLVFLDMDSLKIFNDFVFSISISFIVNVIFYIVYLFVNLSFEHNIYNLQSYSVTKSQRLTSTLQIVSLNQIVMFNNFDFTTDVDQINIDYLSIVRDSLFIYKKIVASGIVDIRSFENKTLDSTVINNDKFNAYMTNYYNTTLATLTVQLKMTTIDYLVTKFNKMGVSTFESSVNNNYNYVGYYCRSSVQGPLNTLFNSRIKSNNDFYEFYRQFIDNSPFNYTSSNSIYDDFYILNTFYRYYSIMSILSLQDMIQGQINSLFYINIFFYATVLVIDTITILYLLLNKIKSNFNMIKNMNDMICSII